MESYLHPITDELEKRARLSSQLYMHLEFELGEVSEDLWDVKPPELEGIIDEVWSCSVAYANNDPFIRPNYYNSYGRQLDRPIIFTLWRRLDPKANLESVLDLLISKIGTVRGAEVQITHDSENPDDMNDATLISTTKELTADEIQGLLNDVGSIKLKATD